MLEASLCHIVSDVVSSIVISHLLVVAWGFCGVFLHVIMFSRWSGAEFR